MVFKSLRLCSHFADRFYSEMIMLRNDLSSQPVVCSRIKCPQGIKTGYLSSPETCNMTSTVEKTNINNVKDDQNCNRTLQEIEVILENFIFLVSLFRFMLQKVFWNRFTSIFLSGVELLQFMLDVDERNAIYDIFVL